MSETTETAKTIRLDDKCPNCGAPKKPGDSLCSSCGFTLDPISGLTPTGVSPRNPSLVRDITPLDHSLRENMFVVFQFLPSGSCLSLAVNKPLVVGRRSPGVADDFLDLSEFQAAHHGVSRRHCRFWRMFNHLLVMDLGSTNGTFLSGGRLIPQFAYVVRPHSRLILGSLHVVVTFANAPASVKATQTAKGC
jgi:rubredoxin